MNDNQIQQILRTIKTLLKCPNCGAQYEQGDVSVVAESENQALVQLNCVECGVTAMADFMVSHNVYKIGMPNGQHAELGKQKIKPKEAVSADDVIKMHQFLKDFTGDLELEINGNEKK